MINKNKPFLVYIFLTTIFAINSCNTGKNSKVLNLEMDSTVLKIKYSNTIFTIPSPNQTLTLLKSINIEYQPDLLKSKITKESYTTTLKKTLILGMLGTDVSYLNLYNQKSIAIEYLYLIQNLIEELELSQPFQPDFFKKMEENFGYNDSITILISQLFLKCDEYLKSNDRYDMGIMLITGGWIESFYFLTELYTQTNNNKLFTLILYQKNIINNLIKLLTPLYQSSSEFKGLIDDLINIAYEFDVIDTEYDIVNIITDTTQKSTYTDNITNYKITGSQLENISTLAKNLRNNYLF